MMKIYVACPAGCVTGGIELLHQLAHELNQHSDVKAYIWYPYDDPTITIPEAYKKYGNELRAMKRPDMNAVLIFPEVWVTYANKELYKNYKKVIYWESVDNYFLNTPQDQTMKFPDGVIHMAQSWYAMDFVKQKIGVEALYLTDYLNEDFLSANPNKPKKRQVLYNPKKGLEYTEKVMKLLPDVTFVPIQNMTTVQIISLMEESMIYIDLGHHPGKDRIPREAAMCGCCVLTSLNGSAANDMDVPIQKKYKYSRYEDEQEIADEIVYILDNYNKCKKDFDAYRRVIMKEPELFKKEVSTLLQIIIPRFSIIIPAHNSSTYIHKALNSIKNQSFKDYELIVVCDNCFDNTEQIAKEYGAKTKRVQFGCDGPTRNKGIEMAIGEYVLFMDDDDWWLHEFVLEQLDKKLEELGDADILCFSFIFKGLCYASPLGNGGNHYNACWCKCYKRDKIGDARFSDVKAWSDVDFYQAIMNKGLKIYDWDMPMYYYNFMRKGSQSEQML